MPTNAPRPWQEIAAELKNEHDLDRLSQLSDELSRALAEQNDSKTEKQGEKQGEGRHSKNR